MPCTQLNCLLQEFYILLVLEAEDVVVVEVVVVVGVLVASLLVLPGHPKHLAQAAVLCRKGVRGMFG